MTPKSVLLVDDEETILTSTGWLLENNNFSITKATSGQQAIDLLGIRPYDLVISALKIAGIDGLSLVKQAKILFPHISVIILIKDGNVSSAAEAFKLGADDYLRIPFDNDDLIYKVNLNLAKQDTLAELRNQNEKLKAEITTRKCIEGQLRDVQAHLERQVEKKTVELGQTVEELHMVLDTLRTKEKELEIKNQQLNNTNAALTVMLQRREQEHEKIRKELADNIEEKVLPLLKKAQNKVNDQAKDFIATAQANLMDIFTSHPHGNQLMYVNLTPRELQIVYYIRKNKTSKEIAAQLGLKVSTVEFYRENIRKKLRIKNKKINLKKFITTVR